MKIDIKIAILAVLIVCCMNAAGCVSLPKSYNTDAKPIYPELGTTVNKYYQVIDTLQPELKWKDIKSEGQTYDVCVWETQSQEKDKSMWGMMYVGRDWGRQIYYVQDISENHVKIDKQLKPNTCYHWSVRTHKGSDVSEWSSFSQGMVSVLVIGYHSKVPYGFITPEK